MNKFFQKLVNFSMAQVLVMGLVAGLGYYFFMYNDGSALKGEIANLEGQSAQEETKKKDTDNTLKEEARMKESIVLLSQQYAEISKQLPTSLTSIDINRNIDAFARNAGVSIKSRKPGTNIRKEIVDEVPVSVTLEGTYSELASFLFLVSSSEKAASMKAFTLSGMDSKAGGRLRLDGTVTGYQMAEEKPAKEGAKGAP